MSTIVGDSVASASIEVAGADAERLAGDLQGVLEKSAQRGDTVGAVEVERSAEVIVAVIGLVFSGVSTAKVIWDWWRASKTTDAKVTIHLDDGTRIELSGVDQKTLETALGRRVQPELTGRGE
ncbi:hypothetical protein AB0C12_15785 [Actinoplanes sp. NPDC048967]|uniref:effector-associated constant component EACC1 n=1 Tax=Actinoplanes sp. NPDC048967 TaxID=3155269 RepID=UPI0033FA6C1C